MADCGYGALLFEPKWRHDAMLSLSERFGPKMQEIFESYHAKSRSSGYRETKEEYLAIFPDDYENETYLWSGILGIIADVINENEFDGKTVFRAGNCPNVKCLYVSADIPENEEERNTMTTKETIRKIVAQYVGPLLDSAICFNYIELTE